MKNLKISADRKYEIHIDVNFNEAISTISKKHNQILLVLPAKMAKIVKLKKINNVKVMTVPDGEAQKDFKNLQKIWLELGRSNFSRSDAIIGLGGGATTDLAGFAAASWLRGISWYAIPTSLAAMVDASIGGKTAINSPAGKNLIGAFYSPSAVYIDLDFLITLPKRDISAGMAEVIKCGFISDKKILDLGCLRGNYLSLYMAENAKQYIGIDLSDVAITSLQKRIENKNLKIKNQFLIFII